MDVIGELILGVLIAALGGFLGRGHVTLRRELKGDIKGLDGKVDGLGRELRADIKGLSGKIEGVRRELRTDIKGLDGKIEGFRQELKADINELRNEMAIMRSDITHIALAVGARPRAEGE